MARLTKAEAKRHASAEALLRQDTLTEEEQDYVLENWQESAEHVNGSAGAFFTPQGLARDLNLEVSSSAGSIVDLCAGIGSLSIAIWRSRVARASWEEVALPRLVCVEINQHYVEIGKKLLPEAEWICGSIFDLPPDLGTFDVAVSNPPFGRVQRDGSGPTYTGSEFEFHVVDVAAQVARYGVFVLPASSAGFDYSGAPYFRETSSDKVDRFTTQTGLRLDAGIGIDTSIYDQDWHGVSPRVEIACADFEEQAAARAASTDRATA